MAAAPVGHGQVARVAPARTSLFVAEKVGEGKLTAQCFQHLRHGTGAHQQRQATRRQIALQFGNAGKQEANMARVAFGAFQPLRLDHHQAYRIIKVHRFGQRGVVAHTQVALEPDQCCRACHIHEREQTPASGHGLSVVGDHPAATDAPACSGLPFQCVGGHPEATFTVTKLHVLPGSDWRGP